MFTTASLRASSRDRGAGHHAHTGGIARSRAPRTGSVAPALVGALPGFTTVLGFATALGFTAILGFIASIGLVRPAFAQDAAQGAPFCISAWVGGPPGGAPAARTSAPQASRLRLTLNIPAFRLDVYEDGDRTRSYPVAVGAPAYPTPTGSYAITQVNWNPWWHPPESDWAKDAEPVAPGPGNPMGRVKIQFEGLYYIHGTSDPNSLMRTVSHGCVRMANRDAIELARLIHRHGSPELPSSELDRLEADPEATRWITLDAPIPFQVEYRLVEIRAGILEVHPDIYDLARIPLRERIIEALQREGHDTARLDPERLEAFARRGSRTSAAVPVRALFRAERAERVRPPQRPERETGPRRHPVGRGP